MLNNRKKANLIEISFALQFTNTDLREIEDMERLALENVSHLSFIQEPRGQNKAWIKGGRIQEGYSRLRELLIHQQKEFERKRAEIREREEKKKEDVC